MLDLGAGDYRLQIDPERGGAITRFDWRGRPVMRPACGPAIFDVACFPLVPFSNRIARGRFVFDDRKVTLTPNFPGADHPHALHGFGWLAPWRVVSADATAATIAHVHRGGEWPWPYQAQQSFVLAAGGLMICLSLRNLAEEPMPAGLGFHPYFPRDATTIYRGLHRGEWRNDGGCLPVELHEAEEPHDWWADRPVAARAVDTAYTDRDGALEILQPGLEMGVMLTVSDNLPVTVVYTPAGTDFFCVEPVSHATDAANRGGMATLGPGEEMTVSLRIEASPLEPRASRT